MNTTTVPDFNLEYEDATQTSKSPDVTSTQTVPEIPVKYQGKSLEDIIKMHQEAERLASRVGNDLAAQRQLTDTLLDLRKNDNTKVPEKKPITTDELFQDPNKAIEQAIQNSEPVKVAQKAQERVDQLERSMGQRDFEGRFPNFKDDITNPTFQDWIRKNPARIALIQRADQFDYQAANALWDMWAEYQEISGASTKTAADEDRKARTRAAKTVKSAAPEGASKGGPVYSRAKLMELRVRATQGDQAARARIDDPEFQRELTQAYAEGRVK